MVAKDRAMCLSTSALILFISLLPPEIISDAPGQITVHATTRDAVWQVRGDLWCTERPRITTASATPMS